MSQKIPKSVPKKYQLRVEHWDDERDNDNSLIVSLKAGWRFPAVECHTQGFDTVRDAIDGLRESKPCECTECLKALSVAA